MRSSSEISSEYICEKDVLVQGVIDAYFEEDGEIVIVDYKTDAVQTAEELSRRYLEQLKYSNPDLFYQLNGHLGDE